MANPGRRLRLVLIASVAEIALCAGVTVRAEVTQTPLEEVVVTARRKSENLEKVPIAITALDSQKLKEQSIRTEADLQFAVPGLILRSTVSQNQLAYSLRGQSVDAFTGSSPAVQAYVNDVQANFASAQSLFDVSSVQVLKGPQGTLFGRNATGGAVLYVTHEPGKDFGGYLTVRAGNYNLVEAQGAVNLPVSDKILVRLAADAINQTGYQENVYYPNNPQWLGAKYNQSYRASVILRPVDGLENKTVAQYDRANGNNIQNELWSVYTPCGSANNNGIPLTSSVACVYAPVSAGGLQSAADWAKILAAHPGAAPGGIVEDLARQRSFGAYKTSTYGPSLYRGHDWTVQNTTSFDINADTQVKNIFGASHSTAKFIEALAGSPYGITQLVGDTLSNNTGDIESFDQKSDELQLLGTAFRGEFDYVLGLYWNKLSHDIDYNYSFFELQPLRPGAPVTYLFTLTSESAAAYGQGTYSLARLTGIDGLKLTGGLRWTTETDQNIQKPYAGSPFYLQPNGIPYPREKVSFQKPSWTASIEYQATQSLLTYVSYTGSWRSGGLNGFATPIKTTADHGGNLYLPEVATQIEVGEKFRGSLLGMPAVLNTAIYNLWIDNVQRVEYIPVPGLPGQTAALTANIPAAQVPGVEFDGDIYPSEWLNIGAGVAYTSARYTNGTNTVFGQEITYGPYGDTARWSGSAHVRVGLPTPANRGEMAIRAEVYAQTGQYFGNLDNTTIPGTWLPGYALINLRYDWDGIFKDLSLGVFCKNVTNKDYWTGGIGVGLDFGVNTAIPGQPRMFGAELSYKL